MPDAQDKITIHGLRVQVRVGWSEEERAFPQRLTLDIDIDTNTSAAARSGDLADTVCYRSVSEQITALSEGNSWRLLESMAHDILSTIFESFPQACGLRIAIKKYAVPTADSVGIEVVRSRKAHAQL